MAALTAAWLIASPPPRILRAVYAVLFILLAQTAYLVVLAFSDKLTALLPPQAMPTTNDVSHLGIWTWGNALRTLVPWNLPLVCAMLQCAVAVGMFRPAVWQTDWHVQENEAGDDSVNGKRRNHSAGGKTAFSSEWRRFGPAGLMIVAAVALVLSPVQPDLTGRRIVAYDDGTIDWSTVDPGLVPPGRVPRYGLLPALVESLGGQFIRSRDLADADLRSADVLIVLPPRPAAHGVADAAIKARRPSKARQKDVLAAVATTRDPQAGAPGAPSGLNEDVRDRIWTYVSGGGRMIVAGDPATNLGVKESFLNSLLQPTGISFRDDTADSLTERWEDNLQAAPHAATASSDPGRSQFSIDRAASLRISWPAVPLLVGHWGWNEAGNDPDRRTVQPYAPGNHLGDLVLAAQQKAGRGTVVVLGATGCLSNDGLPFSYTSAGPLLAALAADSQTPLAWWRQILGLATAGAAMVWVFHRFDPLRVATASAALSLAVFTCSLLNKATAELLPLGDRTAARRIIYVDGSHLEAMGKDPWCENGIGRLMRVLADNNYLPLAAPDLAPERLRRAAMLISIAPARAFSSGEMAAVEGFVKQGGFFLSMVGSPEAEPSRALLEKLSLDIKPMPVPPWIQERETIPLGRFAYPNQEQPNVEFYAAWPVSSTTRENTWPKDGPLGEPVIAGQRTGQGQAFILGDTAFALNKNFEEFPDNASFWRSMLGNWLGRKGP